MIIACVNKILRSTLSLSINITRFNNSSLNIYAKFARITKENS